MKKDSATTLEAGDTQKDTILENVTVSQHKEDRDQKTDKETANNQKTIEEVVNDIAGKPTIWSVVLVVFAMSYGLSVDSLTYDTVFAGMPTENNYGHSKSAPSFSISKNCERYFPFVSIR